MTRRSSLQHDRVDPLDAGHALLEVLPSRPGAERLREVAVEAEPREPLPQLGGELVVHLEPLLGGRLPEQELVDAGSSRPSSSTGRSVVVDPEVDDGVGEAGVAAVPLHDEERRRLLAAPVAARRLRRGEAADAAGRPAAVPRDASNASASAVTVSRRRGCFPARRSRPADRRLPSPCTREPV